MRQKIVRENFWRSHTLLCILQGPISLSEVKLEKCTVSRRDEPQYTESLVDQAPLSWKDLVNSGATYQVTFDMLDDLINPLHEAYSIKRNMTRKLHYRLTDCSFLQQIIWRVQINSHATIILLVDLHDQINTVTKQKNVLFYCTSLSFRNWNQNQ